MSSRRSSILGQTLTEMGTVAVGIGSVIFSGLITTAILINNWPVNGPHLGLILLSAVFVPIGFTASFYFVSGRFKSLYTRCCYQGIDSSSSSEEMTPPAAYLPDDYLLQFKPSNNPEFSQQMPPV